MDRDDLNFLAYVIVKGKSNLTADEQTRLQDLASEHLQTDVHVIVTVMPVDGGSYEASGVIEDVIDGQVKIKLDEPIDTQAAGMTVTTDEITVARDQVRRDTSAPVA